MTTVIYLDPEITITDMNKIARSNGLRLVLDTVGHYVLELDPHSRLPSGARYISSASTNVKTTIERVKAQQIKPPNG
jgi:hypothetical protein